MTLTIGSLFSGIGGLELGLERAGMKTSWQVEIDPYARAVLTKHWPDALRFEDVREVGAHNAPPVDLICGGFPCQDISVAGKRAGLEGERSGLWFEFARIVRELRPRYVVVENVSALLGLGLGRVLGDLAACGYDAEWDCIPAAAVGAPHRRDRLFIVAYANGDRREVEPQRHSEEEAGCGVQPRNHSDGLRHHVAHPNIQGLEGRVLHRVGAGERLARTRSESVEGIWSSEPDVGRVAHGVSKRVDRLRCLGNAVVPQVAEYIGRAIMQREVA